MKNLLLLISLIMPSVAFADGPFVDLEFEEACKEAKASDRVVFVDFYTTWCGPCKKLDATTWKDETVVAWLNENTVALKIDAEKQPELAARYKVSAYPTMVFVEASGELKGSVVGYRDPTKFLVSAKDAMAGIKPSDRLRDDLAKDPKNPMLKKGLASALLREGNEEEALELLLWCWDHGTEPPHESFSAVRVSFLLSDLKRLGKKYPPAQAALVERRDNVKKAVLGERPTREATKDFIKLNATLGDESMTLEVYERIVIKSKEVGEESAVQLRGAKEQLFTEVVPMLNKAGRYDEVVAGFGDPMVWVKGEVDRMKLLEDLGGVDAETLEMIRELRVKEAAQLYTGLLGTKKHDAVAAEFAAKLVDFSPSVDTWKTLLKGAKAAQRKELVASLRVGAQKALSKADYELLVGENER